jgi:molybdopterin synthase sulfur carrier subunit
MAVNVLIPTPLRNLTGGADTVEVEAADINNLVKALEAAYPGIGNRLSAEDGTLRRFINLYLNGEDIRFLQSGETQLKDGDEVSIVPAIAGGKDN